MDVTNSFTVPLILVIMLWQVMATACYLIILNSEFEWDEIKSFSEGHHLLQRIGYRWVFNVWAGVMGVIAMCYGIVEPALPLPIKISSALGGFFMLAVAGTYGFSKKASILVHNLHYIFTIIAILVFLGGFQWIGLPVPWICLLAMIIALKYLVKDPDHFLLYLEIAATLIILAATADQVRIARNFVVL